MRILVGGGAAGSLGVTRQAGGTDPRGDLGVSLKYVVAVWSGSPDSSAYAKPRQVKVQRGVHSLVKRLLHF